MRSGGRWVPIALAIVLIASIEVASDSVLDEALPFPWDALLVTAVVALVALVAARAAFASIDRLTAALRTRNEQLEARNASARALHQVTVAVAALHDLDEILDATVGHARTLLAADAAVLGLVDPHGRPVVRARSGPNEAFVDDASAPLADGLVGALRSPYRRRVLEAPLQHGGRTFGSLLVASASERGYGIDDVETLGSLAGQAAIAIEQDRVERQLRELAVRRERERIARDLHDGVAQVLGYVNAKSQAVDELLETGREPEAREQLAQLGAAARSVYVDVRTAIRSLASPIATEESLADALERVARAFGESSKVAVSVEVSDPARAVTLPATTVAEVTAITREALANVQKHAAAARVEVTADVADGRLEVAIADDGRGFDPAADDATADWPHYGRTTIRERAAAVGGRVEWVTAPGSGTVVRLEVPLPDEALAEPPAPPAAPAEVA